MEGKLDIRKQLPASLVVAFKAAAQDAGISETEYLKRLMQADPAIAEKLTT